MASSPVPDTASSPTQAAISPPPPEKSPPPASPPPPTEPQPSPSPPPASPPPSSPPPSSPPPSSPPPSSPPPSSPPPPPPDDPEPTPSPPPKDDTPTASPPPPAEKDSPPPPPTPGTPSPPPPVNSAPSTNGSAPGVFNPPPPVSNNPIIPTPPSAGGKLSPPRSPPTHKSPPGSPPSPPSSDSSSSTVIIAGIVVAGVLALAVVIVCLVCAKKRKKQPYYVEPGHPPKGGDPYYNATNQWNSPQPMDHIIKLPPPPGVMGTPMGGAGGWGATPPPPIANTSSEFSSGPHPPPGPPSPMGGIGGGLGFSKSQFTYEELAAATGGFSQANLLGQGGFGYVHKGVFPDGKEVAVKSLKADSGQGEREFQAEVEIISRVHHRHLVSLVGYCIGDNQRMLVYEFVANKTLEFHLHGKGQPVMDWGTRLQIALGSAKGLAYLHEDCHPRIIHRDIKAANILLDDKYEAMVADFGLAKLSSDNYTHVSTRVMGTFGYLAPEYASSGKLTEKSDVFSFGVMLLELITGRRPVDPTSKFMEDSLVDWARPLLTKSLEDGNYSELVDPRLEGNYLPHELARMIACASASIRHSARRRPKMSQIVRALDGDSSLEDLNDGPKQGHTTSSGSGSETQTYDTGMYNADMMKFRKMVMSSQDFNSSEYGATSEYGLNPSSSSSDDFGTSGSRTKNH